jgi:hypothetical protein
MYLVLDILAAILLALNQLASLFISTLTLSIREGRSESGAAVSSANSRVNSKVAL